MTRPDLVWKRDIPGGLQGFKDWLEFEDGRTMISHAHRIVCEDFITREGKFGVDTTPLLVIGYVKSEFSSDRIYMRPPAGRKKQVDNAALKRLGLYLPGNANRNALEAVRHVIAQLKSEGHAPTLRWGWPDD